MEPCTVISMVSGSQREVEHTSFSGRAQMLRRPEPEFLQQRREIVRTQLEVLRVFSQPRVHAAGLAVCLPRLWFDDECAARFQHAVYTTEKRGEPPVAVVEMNPFRDGEAEGVSMGRTCKRTDRTRSRRRMWTRRWWCLG